jgi:hypothetical protein
MGRNPFSEAAAMLAWQCKGQRAFVKKCASPPPAAYPRLDRGKDPMRSGQSRLTPPFQPKAKLKHQLANPRQDEDFVSARLARKLVYEYDGISEL